MDRYIFHIVKRDEWREAVARGFYAPRSLQAEGFIHGSTAGQVLETANRWYRGQPDLLLLRIDTRLLTAPLRHEPPLNPSDERRAQLFPHLYGPLNLNAMQQAVEFPCGPDGLFQLPPELEADATS